MVGQGRVTEGGAGVPTHCAPAESRCGVVRPAGRPRSPRCHAQVIHKPSAWHRTPHFICLCSKGIITLPLPWFSSYLVCSNSILFVQVPFFTLCTYSTIGYQSQLRHQCVNIVHLIKNWIYILCILKSSNYTFIIKLYFLLIPLIKILNIQLRKQEDIYVSLTWEHSLVSDTV